MAAYSGMLLLEAGGLNADCHPSKFRVEADSMEELKAKICGKLRLGEGQPMELLVNGATAPLEDLQNLPSKAKVKVQEASSSSTECTNTTVHRRTETGAEVDAGARGRGRRSCTRSSTWRRWRSVWRASGSTHWTCLRRSST